MQIQFLTSAATERRAYEPGEIVDWPDAVDAKRLIAAGYAKPVYGDGTVPDPSTLSNVLQKVGLRAG